MKKLRIVLILLTVFIFYGGSCTKKKSNLIPVTAEVLQHFYFKPGSYWVYKDSVSGGYDSFYVDNNNQYTETDGNNTFQIIEAICFDGNNNSRKLTIDLGEGYSAGFWFQLYNDNVSMGCYYQNGQYSGQFVRNFFPIYHGLTNDYSNVAQIAESSGIFYLNDNVGVIKLVVYDTVYSTNVSWDLVSYKIIR